jgi:hypothetical protein
MKKKMNQEGKILLFFLSFPNALGFDLPEINLVPVCLREQRSSPSFP